MSRCGREELEEQRVVVGWLGGLGVGGALVEEREGSGSDVEAVNAGGLPTVVVSVPASVGVEGAEGIDKVEVGSGFAECCCCDAL